MTEGYTTSILPLNTSTILLLLLLLLLLRTTTTTSFCRVDLFELMFYCFRHQLLPSVL